MTHLISLIAMLVTGTETKTYLCSAVWACSCAHFCSMSPPRMEILDLMAYQVVCKSRNWSVWTRLNLLFLFFWLLRLFPVSCWLKVPVNKTLFHSILLRLPVV